MSQPSNVPRSLRNVNDQISPFGMRSAPVTTLVHDGEDDERLSGETLPGPVQLTAIPQQQRATSAQRHHVWARVQAICLVIYDAVWINVAFAVAYYVRYTDFAGIAFNGVPFSVPTFSSLLPYQLALTLIMIGMLGFRDMYRLRPTGAFIRKASLLFVASTTVFAIYSVYDFFSQSAAANSLHALVIFTWFSAALIPFIGRLILAGFTLTVYRLGVGRTRLLVIGSSRTGKLMLQHFAAAKSFGYQVVGFIHDLESAPEDFGRFRVLGVMKDIERVIRSHAIAEVIVALPASQQQHIAHCIAVCERNGVRLRLVPDLHELSLTRVDVVTLEGVPMFSVGRLNASRWQRVGKRAIDIIGAGFGLLIGAPVWLFIALLIRLDSRGPVIYSQPRVGLHGKTFISYKFRSMHVDADKHRANLEAENKSGRGLFKLKNDPRCTRVGRWLRRLSLDEIPQLLNIVRGDMALVGPRPPLLSEVANYQEWEMRRLAVPPGLTGLWQIRGRSDITFDEMVLMDLFYVENWSLRLDLQILFKTIPAVLFSRGAY